MNARRERVGVLGCDPVGAYTLLRLERGDLEPGIPGQFFMLEVPGRVLPRPMSLCRAPIGELAFLMEPVGPGTRALCALEPGSRIHVFGPLGNGFDLDIGEIAKVADADGEEETVVDLVRSARCDLVINTPQGSGARADGYLIREAALAARVPCVTTISGAAAAVHAIANARAESALSLQERIGIEA